MEKWFVYKSLYKVLYFSGVPILQLLIEVMIVIVACLLGAWLAIIPIIIIHIGIAYALYREPFILSILFDLLSLKHQKEDRYE